MTCNMVKEKKVGTMIKYAILVNLTMERKQERGDLNMKQVSTKVNLSMVSFMEQASIISMENSTKANSNKTKCTAKVLWFGQINHVMKVSSEMERWKEKEQSSLQTETNILDSLRTIKCMDMEYGSASKIRQKDKVNGKTAKDTTGSVTLNKVM